MRTGRQAGLIAWRSQSRERARAAGAPGEVELAQVPEAAPGLQQALLGRHHVDRRAEPALGRGGGARAMRSSASSAAPACGTSARARPPSRRTVATPSVCAQVSVGAFERADARRRRRGSGRPADRRARPSARRGRRRRRPSAAPRARPASQAGRPRRPRSAGRRRRAARPRGGPSRRLRAALPRARRPAPRAGATAGALGRVMRCQLTSASWTTAITTEPRRQQRRRGVALGVDLDAVGAGDVGVLAPARARRRRRRPRRRRARRRWRSGSWRTRVDMARRRGLAPILGTPTERQPWQSRTYGDIL